MLKTNVNYVSLFVGLIILCELGSSLHLWSKWLKEDKFLSLGEEQKNVHYCFSLEFAEHGFLVVYNSSTHI